MSSFDTDRLLGVSPDVVRLAGALLAVELSLLVAYFAVVDAELLALRYVLYPFVWVNVGLLAVWTVDTPRATGRRRLLAAAVALGYFLVVTWVDGTLSAGTAATHTLRVVWLPPGWGPAVLSDGPLVRLALFPFKLVGYAALSFLVSALVVDAIDAGSVLGGAVGLFSCVSCTFPVAAAAVSGVAGGTVGLTTAATAWSYDLSTFAYVVAVALLVWRPTLSTFRR